MYVLVTSFRPTPGFAQLQEIFANLNRSSRPRFSDYRSPELQQTVFFQHSLLNSLFFLNTVLICSSKRSRVHNALLEICRVWSIASIRINQCNWRWDFQIIPRIVNGAGKKPDVGCFLLDCGYWKARNDREYNHYTYTNGFYKVAVNATSQKKRPSLPRQRPFQSC